MNSSNMTTFCSKCFFRTHYPAGITCDGCHRGFCLKCTSLSTPEVRCLKTHTRKIMYLCENCHCDLYQIPKLKYTISTFPAEVERVKCAATALNFDLIISEVIERHKRSKNIIIHNLEESDSSISKEIDDHDKQSVMKIITHVLIVDGSEIQMHRMGWEKPSTGKKPRPVIVSFESTEKARLILRYKLILKAKFSVTIGNDDTPMQQGILRHLREQLFERQKTNSNLTIKYVNGCPRIVEKDLLDM